MKRRIKLGDLVLAFTAISIYAPVLFSGYAWSDDYPTLAGVEGLGRSPWAMYIALGRPLNGLITSPVFDFAGSIPGLRLARLVGVLGLIALSLLISRCLLKENVRPFQSYGLGLAIIFLPALRISAAWAQVFPHVWAAFAAAMASVLIAPPREGGVSCRRIGIASALYGTAFLIYQPAAMFIWVILGIRLAATPPPWSRAREEFLRHCVVVLVGSVGAIGIAIGAANLAEVEIASRGMPSASVSALLDKATFFATRYVPTAARPFLIRSPSNLEALLTAGPVLILTVVGLYMRVKGSLVERTRIVAMTMLLIPLAVLPNLIAKETVIEFRLLIALSPLMLIYMAAAAQTLTESVVTRIPKVSRVGSYVLASLLIVAAVMTFADLRRTFVEPSETKDDFLRAALAGYDPDEHESVIVILPDPPFHIGSAWGAHPNLGDYSVTTDLAQPWVPRPNISLLLLESGIRLPTSKVELVVEEEGPPPPDAYFVDLRPLVQILGVSLSG